MSETVPVLQFEIAEGAVQGSVACATCSTPLLHEYHQLNGQAVCAVCRAKADVEYSRDQRRSQFMIALALGFGASIIGAIIYWGFVKVTDIELGLMAIAVGWLVGKAVMRGSNHRGGRRYQVLAISLTYLSICMSYGAFVIDAFAKKPSTSVEQSSDAAKPGAKLAARASTDSGATTAVPDSARSVAAAGRDSAKDTTEDGAGEELNVFTFMLGVGVILVAILAAPFLAGFSNVIGWVIIAIGMYEAWKLTREVPYASSGPFAIVAPPAPDVATPYAPAPDADGSAPGAMPA